MTVRMSFWPHRNEREPSSPLPTDAARLKARGDSAAPLQAGGLASPAWRPLGHGGQSATVSNDGLGRSEFICCSSLALVYNAKKQPKNNWIIIIIF